MSTLSYGLIVIVRTTLTYITDFLKNELIYEESTTQRIICESSERNSMHDDWFAVDTQQWAVYDFLLFDVLCELTSAPSQE